MIEIRSTLKPFSVNYPEHISEITANYFDKVLNGVKLQQHYCIVATCFYDKIFNLVTSIKQKRDTTAKVTCVMAKIDPANELGFEQMDSCIITRTDLERGVHLPLTHNWIGVQGFEKYVGADENLMKALSTGTYFTQPNGIITTTAPKVVGQKDSPYIYLVEFKILPIRDIVAVKPLVNVGECIFKKADASGNVAN